MICILINLVSQFPDFSLTDTTFSRPKAERTLTISSFSAAKRVFISLTKSAESSSTGSFKSSFNSPLSYNKVRNPSSRISKS